MIVCLDTNIVVQARSSHHAYHPILNACVAGRLVMAVSTGILLEYEEIISLLGGVGAWRKFARLIDLMELTTQSVVRINPHFQFRVIANDPDDNAFVDCAISAGAEYIITEDRHFFGLAGAGYKPQPIHPAEFIVSYPQICRMP